MNPLPAQATADNQGVFAGCFNPRHGLRLTKGNQVVDLFVDGERDVGFLTTGLPQKEFDASLAAARVRLPQPAR
jgi:hypothetical protein